MAYNQPAVIKPTPPAYTKSAQQVQEIKPTLSTSELQVIIFVITLLNFSYKTYFRDSRKNWKGKGRN